MITKSFLIRTTNLKLYKSFQFYKRKDLAMAYFFYVEAHALHEIMQEKYKQVDFKDYVCEVVTRAYNAKNAEIWLHSIYAFRDSLTEFNREFFSKTIDNH